jgi:hypothetical protein
MGDFSENGNREKWRDMHLTPFSPFGKGLNCIYGGCPVHTKKGNILDNHIKGPWRTHSYKFIMVMGKKY